MVGGGGGVESVLDGNGGHGARGLAAGPGPHARYLSPCCVFHRTESGDLVVTAAVNSAGSRHRYVRAAYRGDLNLE
jgi:hypothetical protein